MALTEEEKDEVRKTHPRWERPQRRAREEEEKANERDKVLLSLQYIYGVSVRACVTSLSREGGKRERARTRYPQDQQSLTK